MWCVTLVTHALLYDCHICTQAAGALAKWLDCVRFQKCVNKLDPPTLQKQYVKGMVAFTFSFSHHLVCHPYGVNLTLKEPGFLDPSHSRGGRFHPPKISETDWRNIKCVVLVDSYDPPESIGTQKSTNIPCMTP